MDTIIKANQVKNGSLSKIYVRDKLINSAKSIVLDIKPDICIGKILCYEVDQEVNNQVLVKSELENLLGKKFDVVIEDNDYENTNNNIISIKNCYMYRYYHFISGGNIRMIQYEFSFQNENKKEYLKNDELTEEVAKDFVMDKKSIMFNEKLLKGEDFKCQS